MVFEYPTNYSGGLNVTGPGGFFMDYPVHIIGQFGGAILLLIWMAVFGVSFISGSKKAILVASFVTSIFSIFFAVREWINPVITIVMIIVTIIAAIGVKSEGSY